MAKTGSITITQGTQDVANNQTYITVKGTITTSGDSYRGSSNNGTITVTQDNISIYSGTFAKSAPKNSTTDLFEIGFWVIHKSDGSSGTIDASYDYDGGWCTASTSTTLTDITRTFTNKIGHWASGFKNGEGNNGFKDAYNLIDTTFVKSYGEAFQLTSNDATTIPNGFYLVNTFGTSSISGTWIGYALGTTVTQQANEMYFEYAYYPINYNIIYDLDGGTNNASNPSTYNVLYGVSLKSPTKPYYTFDGWEIKTEAKNISLVAASGQNYNFDRILSNIQPGVQYTISLTGKLNSGTATGFRILTYDFTSGTILTESVTIPFGSNIVKTYTCPSNADASHDIAIIIYAGVNGSTAGNNVIYSDIVVTYRYATGINEGDNATFSSSSDLYNKLGTRMTGNVTAKAIWQPYKYTITFDGNGGTTTVDSLEVAYETTQNNDIGQYIPQRQAYEFLGWYTSPTGGVQVYDANGVCTNDGIYWLNDVCIYTNDYTLYAQWKVLNIAYYKHKGEWKLCRTYIKENNEWKPAMMYIKSNGTYIR